MNVSMGRYSGLFAWMMVTLLFWSVLDEAHAQGFGDFAMPPPERAAKPALKPPPKPAVAKPKPKPVAVAQPKPKPRPKAPSPIQQQQPAKPQPTRLSHTELTWISGRKRCTGKGQECNTAATWRFETPFEDEYQAVLEIPAIFCSPAVLTVQIDSRVLGYTQTLLPGQSQEIALDHLSANVHTLRISATGQEGGCNTGRIDSWGVDVLVRN